jgi:hypothetical protein
MPFIYNSELAEDSRLSSRDSCSESAGGILMSQLFNFVPLGGGGMSGALEIDCNSTVTLVTVRSGATWLVDLLSKMSQEPRVSMISHFSLAWMRNRNTISAM